MTDSSNSSESRDRLDRLETLAGNILLALDQLRLRQEISQGQIDQLRQSQAETNQRIDNFASEVLNVFGEVFGRIDEMQSEVRGLQTESRRILDEMQRRDNE